MIGRFVKRVIKNVIMIGRFVKRVIKEMGSKVCYLAGFWHHYMTTTSVHKHAYRLCLKGEQKQVCEQSL